MRILSYLFLVLVIILGISFATLNSEMVNVNYYVGHKNVPLSFLMVSVFATGSLLGLLVGLFMVVKAKIRNYRLKQRLKLAEKEIENLRAIPLQDKH